MTETSQIEVEWLRSIYFENRQLISLYKTLQTETCEKFVFVYKELQKTLLLENKIKSEICDLLCNLDPKSSFEKIIQALLEEYSVLRESKDSQTAQNEIAIKNEHDYRKLLEEEKEKLKNHFQGEKQTIQEVFNREKKEMLDNFRKENKIVQSEHSIQIKELKTQIKDIEAFYKDDLTKEKRICDEKMKSMEDKHIELELALKQQHKDTIDQLKAEFRQKYESDLRTSLETNLRELKAEIETLNAQIHAQNLEKLKINELHRSEIHNLQAKHREELKTNEKKIINKILKRKMEDKGSKNLALSQDSITSCIEHVLIIDRQQAEITSNTDKIADLMALLASKEAVIDSQNKKHASEIQTLNKEIKSLTDAYHELQIDFQVLSSTHRIKNEQLIADQAQFEKSWRHKPQSEHAKISKNEHAHTSNTLDNDYGAQQSDIPTKILPNDPERNLCLEIDKNDSGDDFDGQIEKSFVKNHVKNDMHNQTTKSTTNNSTGTIKRFINSKNTPVISSNARHEIKYTPKTKVDVSKGPKTEKYKSKLRLNKISPASEHSLASQNYYLEKVQSEQTANKVLSQPTYSILATSENPQNLNITMSEQSFSAHLSIEDSHLVDDNSNDACLKQRNLSKFRKRYKLSPNTISKKKLRVPKNKLASKKQLHAADETDSHAKAIDSIEELSPIKKQKNQNTLEQQNDAKISKVKANVKKALSSTKAIQTEPHLSTAESSNEIVLVKKKKNKEGERKENIIKTLDNLHKIGRFTQIKPEDKPKIKQHKLQKPVQTKAKNSDPAGKTFDNTDLLEDLNFIILSPKNRNDTKKQNDEIVADKSNLNFDFNSDIVVKSYLETPRKPVNNSVKAKKRNKRAMLSFTNTLKRTPTKDGKKVPLFFNDITFAESSSNLSAKKRKRA